MHVKISARTLGLCVASVMFGTGCATQRNEGSAPGVVSGTAQSDSKKAARDKGEFYNTETLTPGVGSALFPDPGWR